MIENRHRIEGQIFLGRKASRRIAQADPLAPAISSRPQRDLASRAPPIKIFDGKDAYDSPMPVDSDAEAAYASGRSLHLRAKSGRSSKLSRHKSVDQDEDADEEHSIHPEDLRSPVARRKWTSRLLGLDPEAETRRSMHDEYGSGQVTPPTTTITPPSPKQSFFARVRSRSFSAVTSPFSARTVLRRESFTQNDEIWSSESSSDDDELTVDDRRHVRNPSVLDVMQ